MTLNPTLDAVKLHLKLALVITNSHLTRKSILQKQNFQNTFGT